MPEDQPICEKIVKNIFYFDFYGGGGGGGARVKVKSSWLGKVSFYFVIRFAKSVLCKLKIPTFV